VGAATQPTRLAGVCVMSIVVVVPCDHPFGWEALVNPSWPGLLLYRLLRSRGGRVPIYFSLTRHKLFMIAGVVLNNLRSYVRVVMAPSITVPPKGT